MTSKREMLRLVAIDDGHNNIKAMTTDGSGGYKRIRIDSAVAFGSCGTSDLEGNASALYTLQEGEQEIVMTVASRSVLNQSVIDTRMQDYPLSPVNRTLVAHALFALGVGSEEKIALVTGLPLSEWKRPDRKELCEKKMLSLKKPARSYDGWTTPEIVWQDVYPEAYSAYLYGMEKGKIKMPTGGYIVVVDIGGRTTDVAVIAQDEKGRETPKSYFSFDIGALNIRDQIRTLLIEKENIQKVSENMVDAIFRSGNVRLFGKERDFSALRNNAIRAVQREIAFTVNRHIHEEAQNSIIWVVGGGANIFRLGEDLPKDWEIVIAEEPEYANVQGMWMRAQIKLIEQGYGIIDEFPIT